MNKNILEKIILKDVPFALAIRNGLKKGNLDGTARSNITALLGCELRHHLMFDNLINRFFENIEFEKTVNLRFLISNILFLKRFENKIIYNYVLDDLDRSTVDALLEFIDSTNEIIPNDLDKSSPEYLSMRFNTPAWVIKMWQKQYGKGAIFKVLKANYRHSIPTIRVNEKMIDIDNFINKYPEFAKTSVKNILAFTGKNTPKGIEEFKTNKVFFMRLATKAIVDDLDIEPMRRIAMYSDIPDNIYLDLIARFGSNLEMDMILSHDHIYYETKKSVEENGYNNIHLYNATASSIITCISQPVGLFFCLPRSTAFDLLRSTPDYFLRVKKEDLDGIIQEQNNALEEIAPLVEKDGTIVYLVPTLSRKESTTLIGNFLFKHPEFSLVKDQQFFPFEEYDSCLYYALLKKTGSEK